jgi:hypothetical protein
VRAPFLAVLATAGFTLTPWNVVPAAGAQRQAPECHEWRECSQLALDARARGQYERFHDLAWRAVQTGPTSDPALMYLLARSQALSGRARDALIMLRRLADRGIVTDAATDQDLESARRLPGWQDVERAMNRVASTAAPPAAAAVNTSATVPETPPTVASTPATRVATPAPAPNPRAAAAPNTRATAPNTASTAASAPLAPARSARSAAALTSAAARAALPVVTAARPVIRNPLRFDPRPSEEVSRFSSEPFVPSGLAYDAVSGRFLFGDTSGRRVIVLGERFSTAVDLVRAASAQFNDVTAFEIDARRGDLWVASTASDGSAGAIHRLQLVSGRPIALVTSPSTSRMVRLIDLAVAANGTVLVLDSSAPQILRLRPGMAALDEPIPLDVVDATSITAAGDDRTAFVAHRDGIARVDLQLRTATPVTAPVGIELAGFERIRWHRNELIGVQLLPDGLRHVVRLPVNRAGSVTDATAIGEALDRDQGPAFVAVSNDDVYYLATRQADSQTMPGAKVMNVVVNRIRLP